MILQSWIHWRRGRRPFCNKIGEVGGRRKIVGGESEKHRRLISTQYFYFLDKNNFKKLSAAPITGICKYFASMYFVLAHPVVPPRNSKREGSWSGKTPQREPFCCSPNRTSFSLKMLPLLSTYGHKQRRYIHSGNMKCASGDICQGNGHP